MMYYLMVPGGPIWLSFGWNGFFVAINAVQIAVLLRERRRVVLTDEERELHETSFRNMTPVRFLKLVRLAAWREAAAGDVLARAGDLPIEIMLIARGEVQAMRNGQVVRVLRDGGIVGEIAYVAHRAFTAEMRASQPTRLLVWPKAALDRLFLRNPLTAMDFEAAFIAGLERAPSEADASQAASLIAQP